MSLSEFIKDTRQNMKDSAAEARREREEKEREEKRRKDLETKVEDTLYNELEDLFARKSRRSQSFSVEDLRRIEMLQNLVKGFKDTPEQKVQVDIDVHRKDY